MVGEAVNDEIQKFNTDLTVLGIATFGTIKNKEKLVKRVKLRTFAMPTAQNGAYLQSGPKTEDVRKKCFNGMKII